MTTTTDLAAIVATHTLTSAAAAGYTRGAAVAVGDLVLAPVRGNLRAAVVTKVGRTNVTVQCTTPSAIAEAEKVRIAAAARLTPAGIAAAERSTRKHTEQNFVFYAEQVARPEDRYNTAERIAAYRAHLARGVDATVADSVARGNASAERALTCAPCVTTKSVKATDVWAR